MKFGEFSVGENPVTLAFRILKKTNFNSNTSPELWLMCASRPRCASV